jgi:hypothetical protein
MLIFLRRFLARLFDYGLFYSVTVFISLVLPIDIDSQLLTLWAMMVPFVWAPIEMALLKRFGTTAGKKLFGLSFPPLSWAESFRRVFLFKKPRDLEVRPIGLIRYVIALMLTCFAAGTLFLGDDISEVAVRYEGQVTAKGWVQYISDDGKFQVQFPKKPKEASQVFEVPDGDPINLSEFKVHKEAEFSVSYLDLPKKWKLFSANTLLKGAMGVIVEHVPGSTLIDKTLVKHKSYPAMDFRMKEGENIIEGRLILVGNTLYKLWVVYFPDTPKEAQHETFVSSFELTE